MNDMPGYIMNQHNLTMQDMYSSLNIQLLLYIIFSILSPSLLSGRISSLRDETGAVRTIMTVILQCISVGYYN